jgi:hypothetical protein
MSIPVIFEKQLLINNIMQLCPDVLNIVKEYLFYKRETVYKNKKYKMITQINTAWSRVTKKLHDNNSHWIFWAMTEEENFSIQFQGDNCLLCGNYLYICYHRKHNIKNSNIIFCKHEQYMLP